MENENSNGLLPYLILAGAAGLLLFSLNSFLFPSAAAWTGGTGAPAYGAAPASASLAPSAIPPECGDINDDQNLQHLSHHPDRFQACYRVVDPAKFKAAVGQDVSNFIR